MKQSDYLATTPYSLLSGDDTVVTNALTIATSSFDAETCKDEPICAELQLNARACNNIEQHVRIRFFATCSGCYKDASRCSNVTLSAKLCEVSQTIRHQWPKGCCICGRNTRSCN